MYDPTTCADTPNAISSPELAYGPTLYDLLHGRTIEQSGQAVARASLSARQVQELGLLTSGTFGPTSTTSLRSAALQSSLENRLRAKLQTLGSTLYKLTWKPWIMPSGLSRSRLRASVLRTSETEPTGWPTPTTADGSGGGQAKRAMGETRHGSNLNDFAMLAGWPTTSCSNDRTGNEVSAFSMKREDGSKVQQRLQDFAVLAGWSTPKVADGKGNPYEPQHGDRRSELRKEVILAGWRTPTAQSPNSLRGNGQDPAKRQAGGHTINLTDEVNWLKDNPQPARLTVSGEMLTGSDAAMESGGQLNPAHSRWLMGLPPEWDACAPTVTPSIARRPKPSSKS